MTRLFLAFLVLCVGLASATRAHAAQGNDQAQVRAVFAAFQDGWNRPGFPGLERLLMPDADFVVVTGKWLAGREVIVSYHRDLLKTFYAGSHLTLDKIDVRFIDERHAVAHVAATVAYSQEGHAIHRPSLATVTLDRVNGAWLIETFHNTVTGGPGYMFATQPRAQAK